MTEISNLSPSGSSKVLVRQRLSRLADGLALALAVSLRWSTSATRILAGIRLLAAVPATHAGDVRRVLLFNTEPFDFTQGWAYVIGVGVAGRALPRSAAPCDVLPVGRL